MPTELTFRPATRSAIDLVQSELARLADREKAATMTAYMKTDMPFYGVQKPARMVVFRRELRPRRRRHIRYA